MKYLSSKLLITLLCAAVSPLASAGAFVFSSDGNPNIITHPNTYTGTGGEITVTFCVNPASESMADLDISARNVATVWNTLSPTTGNVLLGANNDIPAGAVDFESTLLHELGHCIGLAHPNLATESGVPAADRDYTQSGDGPNNTFDLNFGADGLRGSSDDIRGDDNNRHWFRTVDNNPFTIGGTVDVSTYSVDLLDLPAGDLFATNADRNVSGLFGLPLTEAVMQQGAFADEDQRRVGHDDVATLRLGMAGVDEIQGTADDYTVNVEYIGVAPNCDVQLNVTGTAFAFCSINSATVSAPNHLRINNANIQLGSATNFNWFFNPNLLVILAEEFFEDGFEGPAP